MAQVDINIVLDNSPMLRRTTSEQTSLRRMQGLSQTFHALPRLQDITLSVYTLHVVPPD